MSIFHIKNYNKTLTLVCSTCFTISDDVTYDVIVYVKIK